MSEQVTLVFNPYQDRLRVSLNGRPAPRYGSLNNLLDKPFQIWSDSILPALSRALNDSYALKFVSPSFEQIIFRKIAEGYRNCISFETESPELNLSTGERISLLNDLRVSIGEKTLSRTLYLEMHVGNGLLNQANKFKSLTGESSLLPDETYDCMLPSSISHWGMVILNASMQRFAPRNVEISNNTLNILLAGTESEATSMLQVISPQDGIVLALVLNDNVKFQFLSKVGQNLIFSSSFREFTRFIELAVDYSLLTPYFSQQCNRLIEQCKSRYDIDQEEIAERIKEISGIEPFYTVQKIDSMEAGQTLKLSVKRTPGGPLPVISVKSEPTGLIYFDGSILTASDDLEKSERIRIEVYASDRPDPISKQSFYINVDETPTTMDLICPSSKLNIGQSVQLRLELAHVKKTTPKTTVWRSSDTRVALVDDNGLVSALSPGRTTVTATKGSLSDQCTINVFRSLDHIELSSRMLHANMAEGQKRRLPIVVYAADDEYDTVNIRCDSNNTAVARFEPAKLSAAERGDVPSGKMILAEGYVCCEQSGKAQLVFYQQNGNNQVKSYLSVTADQKNLPAPKPSEEKYDFEKIIKIAAIALSVLSVVLITTPFGTLVSLIAVIVNAISVLKYRHDRTWWRLASQAVSIITLIIHIVLSF